MGININDPNTWPRSALEHLRRRERATVGRPELVALIRRRIEAEGPLPFSEFMRLALTHPEYGYYTSPDLRFGREGDFLTSPETHPAFGALVCRFLHRLWRGMERPAVFTVVEAGAGTGALAEGVLRFARARHPRLADALRYVIIEASETLRGRQRARLDPLSAPVRSAESLDALPPEGITGCILTNELLDALPVHRVEMTAEGLREIYIGLRDGELADTLGPLSTPEIADHFARVGTVPPPGAQAEVGLEAVSWYRAAAERLAAGALVTMDYGDTAARLYTASRPRGTLLCYYRHATNEEPYRRVGTQDITAHVDFTALMQAGEGNGLRTREYLTQEAWLRGLGIGEWLRGEERWPEEEAHPRSDLAALVHPEALGRLKVLVQTRGNCGL